MQTPFLGSPYARMALSATGRGRGLRSLRDAHAAHAERAPLRRSRPTPPGSGSPTTPIAAAASRGQTDGRSAPSPGTSPARTTSSPAIIHGRPTADFGLVDSIELPGEGRPRLPLLVRGRHRRAVRRAAVDRPRRALLDIGPGRSGRALLVDPHDRGDPRAPLGRRGRRRLDPGTFDAAIAADGVKEYVTLVMPLLRKLRRSPAGPPVQIACTDVEESWYLELTADGGCTVSATPLPVRWSLQGPAAGLLLAADGPPVVRRGRRRVRRRPDRSSSAATSCSRASVEVRTGRHRQRRQAVLDGGTGVTVVPVERRAGRSGGDSNVVSRVIERSTGCAQCTTPSVHDALTCSNTCQELRPDSRRPNRAPATMCEVAGGSWGTVAMPGATTPAS